ncbi:protein SRG1 [Prosopis cineraria]|uniref:protein SRG1 n=1 Tax=Prosopis cineraria TaxID=364024 RepID=UPI00240EFC16|nr:protein SRG1 [Prosopis cineraria]
MAPVLISPLNVGHIDDVQELTKTKPRSIPERFVRDVTERPQLFSGTTSPSHSDMPVIDFSKFLRGNTEEFQVEILKLASACEEWGFFQVKNHGIDQKLLESIEEISKEFFMLPLEEKQKYPMIPGTVQGYGQAFVFSEDQKLDWCNMFALAIEPHCMRNPNLWPNKPERFSETLEEYSREVRKLCQNLLEFIALGLGLMEDAFSEMFGMAVQAVRMNYYPPCSRPDLVMGLSPHSDGSAITVLQQATGSPVGLQIFRDKTWIPVQPIPNAFVINIGDTIEVLTNGKYKSVEHRAVANEEKDRLTIVTFYAPGYEVELGPMPEFVDENKPSKYRRYNHGEYSKHYTTNKLQGKRTLDFAKIHQSENSN